MIGIEGFRRLSSPLAWLSLVEVEFPPVARAIIAAASGSPASPEVHEAWSSISSNPYPARTYSQVVLQIGRGGLKTSMAFVEALDRLFRFPNETKVAAGAEVLALIVAPTKAQAGDAIRNNLSTAKSVADLLGATMEERSLRDGAELVFRIPGIDAVFVLRCAAPDEATLRGGSYCFVSWGEAGWYPSGPKSIGALADLRVAVIPRGLGQFPWFLEIVESTNGPPAGYFYKVCTDTPDNVLKIGPLSSGTVNPAGIDEAKLREELSPEEFSQEILCLTWGLKSAAWFPARESMAIVDSETEWCFGMRQLPGVVSFDHGGKDEIAYVAMHFVEREIAPGRYVRHAVVDHAESWRPDKTPPTEEQVEKDGRLSMAMGGVPILCDNRSFPDVAFYLSKSLGFRAVECKNDEERAAAIRRGGKIIVQMPMDPAHQTARFERLRELVTGGRLHAPDDDGGNELARQLVSARATQLASGYLKIEAESGAEDGLLDCASYPMAFVDLLATIRDDGTEDRFVIEGTHWDPTSGNPLVTEGQWRRFRNGVDVGRGEPPITHPMFPQHFADCVASGMYTDRIIAFAKQRLGKDPESPADYRLVVRQMAESGEIDPDHPAVVVGEGHGYDLDPIAWGMLRGKNRI
ncbi:MAG: hypothetical protein KIS78_07915 [Labilithrix sp.]|nr:hypothetical protein [Labilithrix sp.]